MNIESRQGICRVSLCKTCHLWSCSCTRGDDDTEGCDDNRRPGSRPGMHHVSTAPAWRHVVLCWRQAGHSAGELHRSLWRQLGQGDLDPAWRGGAGRRDVHVCVQQPAWRGQHEKLLDRQTWVLSLSHCTFCFWLGSFWSRCMEWSYLQVYSTHLLDLTVT